MLDKIGLPRNLIWGYIGLMFFMIGDGIEQAWIVPYLVEEGISVTNSSLLITVYGVSVTIAAWLSGVFVQTLGPRKAMLVGSITFLIGSIGFIGIGMTTLNLGVMLPFYAIRGFGYPMFAYSFLVWINYSAPLDRRSSAAGWFWFMFSLGLSVLGPFYASFTIPVMGHINVLWTGIIFTVVGTILAIIVNKDKIPASEITQFSLGELIKAITILKRPIIALGLVVKTINGFAQYGLLLFLPLYLADFGYSTTEWLRMWSTVFTVAIFANVIFGFLGDKWGWRNTIRWVGGFFYAFVLILVYFTPQFVGHNYFVMTAVLSLCGVAMAGYVPLSALFPLLAPDNKGAAMSILNLGAGLSTFIAPGIVALFFQPFGAGTVIFIYAGFYVLSAILTPFLRTPEEQLEQRSGLSRTG
ncbi:MFS transporter [Shouchella clausii]|jgi:polyol permease family|uniref:MFS transporter n=1 Tax=Shouchella clausii TaxID=79880 RepID=UPI002E1A530D|nr:MFS transporter [Shouchella clausii]MED4175969.1 MFS transporter [Shouchella clausii]